MGTRTEVKVYGPKFLRELEREGGREGWLEKSVCVCVCVRVCVCREREREREREEGRDGWLEKRVCVCVSVSLGASA